MLSELNLPSWFAVVLLLNGIDSRKNYYQNLLRKTKIAGSHIRCIIAELKKQNIVVEEKTEKIKYLHLTDKGKHIAKHIAEIKYLLDQ